MILPNATTVAVVDGRTMLLFQNNGREPAIELSAWPPRSLEEGHAGSGTRHRCSAANSDKARLAEDGFAAAANAALNRAAIAGDITKLLIIANSRTLGEMRGHFHKGLQKTLLAEIPKEMDGHAKGEIEAVIRTA